jgi:hypothetical protein
MRCVAVGLAVVGVLFLIAPGYADHVSSFNSGTEGWIGLDPATDDWTANWQSTGGNPDGYLRGSETSPQGGTGYYIAPSSWGGDWTSYIGGTLSYDLKVFSGTSYYAVTDGDIRIYSGSSYAYWNSPVSLYSATWANHQVGLNAANFAGADFNTVMSSVTALWIRGELITGSEAEGLDNVNLRAVPEPSTLIVLLGGLGIAFLWRRRKAA